MKDLIDWYTKHYREEIVRTDDELRSSFNSALSDKDKARLILIGKHQWYLKPFCPDIYNAIIDSMAIDGPWNKMKNYDSFEDVFNDHQKWKAYDYIQQLTVYDIALRLAIINNDKILLPTKKLYLHATPMTAYKWLFNNGLVSVKVKGSNNIVEIKCLKGVFDPLTAREIEDFLCHLEKGIKRVRENRSSVDQSENELDDLISDIIKTKKMISNQNITRECPYMKVHLC
ncbi:MAG: hypothetical protein ACI3YL_03710 [Prevotella sp.]